MVYAKIRICTKKCDTYYLRIWNTNVKSDIGQKTDPVSKTWKKKISWNFCCSSSSKEKNKTKCKTEQKPGHWERERERERKRDKDRERQRERDREREREKERKTDWEIERFGDANHFWNLWSYLQSTRKLTRH